MIVVFLTALLLVTSCGSPDYRIFSLREVIGHFSLEYPSTYTVMRIDIRNDSVSKYTDIGLSTSRAEKGISLGEISVYAWPAGEDETAVQLLEGMLARAGSIFTDFKVLRRFSVMIGDMGGQAMEFSWDAASWTT
jgi:hypothetical protein